MNNIPAFPRPASEAHQHGMHNPQEGMTLRDYFAAKALQAMTHRGEANVQMVSIQAYAMADAMMKAREA